MAIKQRTKSLKVRGAQLSETFFQLEVLNNNKKAISSIPKFATKIGRELKPDKLEVFQINIGKLCNQSCAHCHVDAGPDRVLENMSRETLEKCLAIIMDNQISTVDITGGAPEMNPHFRWFVESLSKKGIKTINRCNLTIIQANPKYYDLPDFFRKNQVHIVSSLPHFSKLRTDRQRGDGVYSDSIKAIKKLNSVGYGIKGSDLILDLVYNPSGAFLPGDQQTLENEYKIQLRRKHGIEFNNLYAITNIPIGRYLEYLIESDNYEAYMEELHQSFNPQTIDGLMCRSTLSVSWDGYIYDCDFNQMLDLKINNENNHIDHFNYEKIMQRTIKVNQHCYGCTAGSGSSCGGEVV
jgi:radical SAM/Cys-rich protein